MENEKRLIDANELLRFLENEIDKHESSLNKWERDYVKAVKVAAKILRCFPTVDAAKYRNYCPNCGAKMDGGKDNET